MSERSLELRGWLEITTPLAQVLIDLVLAYDGVALDYSSTSAIKWRLVALGLEDGDEADETDEFGEPVLTAISIDFFKWLAYDPNKPCDWHFDDSCYSYRSALAVLIRAGERVTQYLCDDCACDLLNAPALD